MKALILSGGSGIRLRPFTYTGAKQLLPVANKPILFYIIKKIAEAGIDDIGIVVGDTSEEIKSAVGNGELWGVRITYIYQSKPLGLAHAVKTAAGFIGSEDFIMVLGDNLFQMDLGDVIEDFHTKAVNAMLVLHISENPSQYGVAVIGRERVIRLEEKPENPSSNLIITGIYVLDNTIFDAIDRTVPSKRGELEITDAIQVLIDSGGEVGYCLTEGWWKDTGSLEDLLEANRLVLNDIGDVCLDIGRVENNGSLLDGMIMAGENVVITDSILEGPIVLGNNISIKGCRLGPYTTVGDNVTLLSCQIRNSIILEGSSISDQDRIITSSLIGKNTNIRLGGEQKTMTFFVGSDSIIIL